MEEGAWNGRLLRSLLFAPGNHARRLERVADFGSDVIVLDLEDAVADTEKERARSMVAVALSDFDKQQTVAVRVNEVGSGWFQDDVQAVVCERLDAIVVPKLESREMLAEADLAIGRAEREALVDEGSIRLLGLLETTRGLVQAEEICASAPDRLLTMCFGLADFALDAGIDLSRELNEISYARSRIVVAARGAGLAAPLDGPWLWLEDIEGLIADSVRSRRLGFQGRVVVYPPHVEHVKRAYSDLPPDELLLLEAIVQTFEAELVNGIASVRVNGTFVDYPVYERAKEKLSLYAASRGSR